MSEELKRKMDLYLPADYFRFWMVENWGQHKCCACNLTLREKDSAVYDRQLKQIYCERCGHPYLRGMVKAL